MYFGFAQACNFLSNSFVTGKYLGRTLLPWSFDGGICYHQTCYWKDKKCKGMDFDQLASIFWLISGFQHFFISKWSSAYSFDAGWCFPCTYFVLFCFRNGIWCLPVNELKFYIVSEILLQKSPICQKLEMKDATTPLVTTWKFGYMRICYLQCLTFLKKDKY